MRKKVYRIHNLKLYFPALLLIFSVTVSLLASCTAAKPETENTITAEETKASSYLNLTSLDKNVVTDDIRFTISQLSDGNCTVKYENLKTSGGHLTVELDRGKYRIEGSYPSYYTCDFEISKEGQTMDLTAENNELYNILKKSKSVCVIGDSITIGRYTDGHGWHESLIKKFDNIKSTTVAAKSGQSSASFFSDKERMDIFEKSNDDTYIIALGVNDCLVRGSDTPTTYNTTEYINNLSRLVKLIREKENGKTKNIIFVAPFEYAQKRSDKFELYLERDNIHEQYINAVKTYCMQNGYPCAIPMNYVKQAVSKSEPGTYMYDDLHPNYPKGTELYSDAVYNSVTSKSSGTLLIKQDFYKKSDLLNEDDPQRTPYNEVRVPDDAHISTVFTIKNYTSGDYIKLAGDDKSDETGNYFYDGESQKELSYKVGKESLQTVIEDIPQGCYEIDFISNSQGYSAYREKTIMYVTADSSTTVAHIYMNADNSAASAAG